jgi:asparagine synthase (glutamine-hydrolysing)
MCGIVGIYRFKSQRPVQASEIDAMCRTMAYRGPDGQGIYCDGHLGFGHLRLSIIDTHERSNQPMHTADQQQVLIYNGELYNYVELREQLQQQGENFVTQSDTEVLLKSWQTQGDACLTQLNGMFAFAIWDKAQQALTLVRDHTGIKPLYYAFTPEGLVFASEIKAILTQLPQRPAPNVRLLDAFMSLGYCPGEETFFTGVYRLRPGHSLTVSATHCQQKAYWDLKFTPTADFGEHYYLQQTRDLLKDAVRLQLRSDVPLGVFLSGGVDSSAVVATMRQLGVPEINTFSINWDYGKNFSEAPYARQVAQMFNTRHHEFTMNAQDFCDFLPNYVRYMDEPVTEAAAISLFYIAKQAREHVTVVLSGEGADEVFGGYSIYRFMAWLESYRCLPKAMRQHLLDPILQKLHPTLRKYSLLSQLPLNERYLGVSLQERSSVMALYSPEFLPTALENGVRTLTMPYYAKVAGATVQQQMQYLDVKTWLVDDLLIKADRMTMANSLELRVPFLDHRWLDFAGRLPTRYRLKNGKPKYLLKKSLEGTLPKSLLYRRKMGFPTPVSAMLKGPLKNMMFDTLNTGRLRQQGYFKWDLVEKMMHEHTQGVAEHHRILWPLLVLEQWFAAYQ